MKITYDKEIDAMYIYLREAKVKKTIPINDNIIVDVDEKGKIIGIEMLFLFAQHNIKIPSDILVKRIFSADQKSIISSLAK